MDKDPPIIVDREIALWVLVVRFICGAVFGAITSIWLLFPPNGVAAFWILDVAITVGCGWLAATHGEDFWTGSYRWLK